MPRNLNSALRASRDRILQDGPRTFVVLDPDMRRESVRDWDTAIYRASRGFAERGGRWSAIEFAWDNTAPDACIVARSREF